MTIITQPHKGLQKVGLDMLVVRQIIRNKQVLLMEVMEKIKFIEIIVWQ